MLVVKTLSPSLGVKVVFASEHALRHYEVIAKQRADVEAEVGNAMEWGTDERRRRRTVLLMRSFDIRERESWNAGIAWLVENAVKVHRALTSRMVKLEGDRD
jgi:hypothetical protein